ncbi:hypothetical protein AAG570_001735 [Ranatra chinensis]|uniref:Calpain-5 n=1 Tax=Ranatra chinensis TaxID=642074 RepID=A0ABD0Y9G4_9HEMI
MVGLKEKLVRFKEQNFEEIKKRSLEQGSLFVDPAFPALDTIIGSSISIPTNIVWKRPGEICADPKLFVDPGRCDGALKSGELSCNWMVSACAILSDIGEIRNKVIPDCWEQDSFGVEGKYCGAFHFRLWRFGNWQDVVVDDFLPTVDNVLLTTQTQNPNEFWTALLEKAYAKLHGSYEALREYEISDALVDFTGGVSEVVDLKATGYSPVESPPDGQPQESSLDARNQLLEMLLREAPLPADIGTRTELGICRGHAYHVTDVKKVYLGETSLRTLFKGREKVAMVRLRDPRIVGDVVPSSPESVGSGHKFAYSTSTLSRLRSRNSDWQKVKDSERHRLGLLFTNNTEFWMPLEDVVGEFTELVMCRLAGCDGVFTNSAQRRWKVMAHTGWWEPSTGTAGGGDIALESFVENPQYLMRIDKEVELMVQLMQFQNVDGTNSPTDHRINLSIGFHIIKVEENRKLRLRRLWPHCCPVVACPHKKRREVSFRGRLPRGTFVVVPSTSDPAQAAQFLLRLFVKKRRRPVKLKELVVQPPAKCSVSSCSCFSGEIEWATVVVVNSAESLVKPPSSPLSGMNVYCKLSCEGKTVRTDVAKGEDRPTWNESYVFYRKSPHKPILLQVFKKNSILPDELVGECELVAAVNHCLTPLVVSLHPKAAAPDSMDLPTVGSVNLTVLTEDNVAIL